MQNRRWSQIRQLCYKSLLHFAVEMELQVVFLGITFSEYYEVPPSPTLLCTSRHYVIYSAKCT